MNSIFITLNDAVISVKQNLPLLLFILLVVWCIHLINSIFHYRLNCLGILPRSLPGLLGIFFSPVLHGSFAHLTINSLMFLVLSSLLLTAGRPIFLLSSVCIGLLSGLLIWLFGRPGIHIGASALVMGYFGFLLVDSVNHPSLLSIVLAVVCVYYFGGMFSNLFPTEKHVSWEGHLCGFVAGIITSFLI